MQLAPPKTKSETMLLESIFDSIVTSGIFRVFKRLTPKRKSLEGINRSGAIVSVIPEDLLDVPFRTVIAGPTDAVVLVKNGEVADVVRESRLSTLGPRQTILSVLGFGPEVRAIKVDLRPFRISTGFGSSTSNPVLDQSGDQLKGAIYADLAFDPDAPEKALWWSGLDSEISKSDIENKLEPEILAVLQNVASTTLAENLRSTEGNVRTENEIKAKLADLSATFGLLTERVTLVMGLSKNEQTNSDLDDLEFEVAKAEATASIRERKAGSGNYTEIRGNQTNITSNGMSGITIVALVAVVLIGLIVTLIVMGGITGA